MSPAYGCPFHWSVPTKEDNLPHGSLPRRNVGDDATISKLNDGLRKKVNPILIAVSIRYAQVELGWRKPGSR